MAVRFAARVGTLVAVTSALIAPAPGAESFSATARKGMVATVHPLATQAGVEALQAGGNAVDAAIAAAVMLGVVDGHNSGIGGGGFILIRTAQGELVAIDAREMAPERASRDMYVVDGKADPELSRTGPLAVAVPGAVAGYYEAAAHSGRLGWKSPWIKAAETAEQGFAVSRHLASASRSTAPTLRRFPGSAAVLLHEDGTPLEQGEMLREADLAAVYRGIAEQGPDYFYRGPVAKAIGAWMQANGGLVTANDFARYRTVRRAPIVTSYRTWTIVGFPPPSSGGVHVAEILNILENFDVAAIHREDPAEALHVIAEAMKLAFADRAYWLGDPDYINVPRGLISKEYARELAARIDRTQVAAVPGHGTPPHAEDEFFQRHTTHVAAADAEGNWVALTQTVNTTFGSKVIVPGTGIVLNNQMDDFSSQPGAPNAFGLIGAEANSIAPGKRPLSSMSPTIVLRDGKPVMTVGAAGGPKIITEVFLTLVRHLDFGMPIADAVAAPRIHHQWSPDRLMIERDAPQQWTAGLEARKHLLQKIGSAGVTQAITLDEEGVFTGVHDPRVEGLARGIE